MPNHALVIGRAQTATISGLKSEPPELILGGAAALVTQELARTRLIRPTLLTAVDSETSGLATLELMKQAGILYRAVPCLSPTPTLSIDPTQPAAAQQENLDPDSISVTDLGRALTQTVADYTHVVADCNLAVPVLENLAYSALGLSIHGVSADRCLRLMAAREQRKTVICVTQRQASALQQAHQISSPAGLNEALNTRFLLITGAYGNYQIYHRGRIMLQYPGMPQTRDIPDYGVAEAAMAGLLAATLTGQEDIAAIMEKAIVARLRENAGLPPD